MSNVIIGILLIASFVFMVWYCMKGYNLMVGFFVMATIWTILALIGNAITPAASMDGKSVMDVLEFVYADGPAAYASSILVNVFFGAFFGRVLMDTGIAATLIRKVVELGGDRPRLTMSLLCIVTAIIFMSMTGIGPVISIAVIVLPILFSLGVEAPVALFAFMGSIMAGIFANMVNFKQYQEMYVGFAPAAKSYTYNDYFTIGMIGMIVGLVVVLVIANLTMKKGKSHNWAIDSQPAGKENAPWYSWISVILPVLGVVLLKLPIILGFILSGIYAMATTGKLKGNYSEICRRFAKLFTDGSIDVAPMIGFLLSLAMFNNAATFAAPYFTAIIGNIVPTTAIALTIVFALLVPLGFFRGPMNWVGSGSAIFAVILAANPAIPVQFMYPLTAATTVFPQHLDVTQSWVAWGFGYAKVSSRDFMKRSIPAGWISGAIMCLIIFIMYGHLV
ncbi:citrate transporter [Lapidilactobacillus luobeiensis]|uniref:citrate transporter n=1 Tax=Lapidilactobacillus luobeiensis TaxID=2950371 RepID=UPI0021C48AFF|nr:citrate transporter [Lapidilactobacillus luobeiensis]